MMPKCKNCNTKLEEAGTVKLNGAPYTGSPFAAFTWLGDKRSTRSFLLFVVSALIFSLMETILCLVITTVFFGYHILVTNDPKQVYNCPSYPKIYVGDKLYEYHHGDDLYR